jgi:hypothetical protein
MSRCHTLPEGMCQISIVSLKVRRIQRAPDNLHVVGLL